MPAPRHLWSGDWQGDSAATAEELARRRALGVDMAGSLPAGALSSGGGVLVGDIVPGSPAAVAGLEPGDVITQIGSRAVASPADVESALAGLHAGERLQIQYQRGSQTYATQATLAVRPANP
jgi:S1-C subfamily serine protease